MASLKVRKFANPAEATLLLSGAIAFPVPRRGDEKVFNLHGKTLVFTAPSATVTFTDATNAGMSLKAIAAEINSDSTNTIKAQFVGDTMYLVQPSPSAAVNLNLATSTAAADLGMKTSGTIVGKFYAPPDGTAPRFVALAPSPQGDSIVVVTEE